MFQHSGSPLLVLQPHRNLKSMIPNSLQNQKSQLFTAVSTSFKLTEKLLKACRGSDFGKVTKQGKNNQRKKQFAYK